MPLIQICANCGATIGTYSTFSISKGKTYLNEITKSSCPACGVGLRPSMKVQITPIS